MGSKGFIVGGISLSVNADESEACAIVASELKRAGVSPARIHLNIYKRSIDARRKNDIKIVYSVSVTADEPLSAPKLRSKYTVSELPDNDISVNYGSETLEYPPLVVGMGPAGLFCALMLAENGYCPILIDRGDDVKERVRKNELFIKEGVLDTESNVQFGAGGAGTFSDGKLLTRIGDKYISYVLDKFCEFGAAEDIKISSKPHIGTDMLVEIVENILHRIETLGGKVVYRCRLDDISELSDGNVKVTTTKGDMIASSVVLAVGHSAQDTYKMLMAKDYFISAKAFSVGVRIEHRQADIDKALYGDLAGHRRLGKAEYHLSDTTSGRGVYTFCMCPGGQVVAATSDEGRVVVNGMSNHKRDGVNANSAVLVTVRAEDYGATPEAAMEFQKSIEQKAYIAGGENYYAPVQTVGDFLVDSFGTEPTSVIPTYRDGRVKCAKIDNILPKFVTDELRRGLVSFDKKIKGFASHSAVMTGAETRTSAPIRITRDNEKRTAIGHARIYPCGEGAGYAGGITSAAVDGLKTAISIMERYSPEK